MSDNEYARAIAEFMAKRGVTRCPTACVGATHASVTEADRNALRDHEAAREAARQAKARNHLQIIAP